SRDNGMHVAKTVPTMATELKAHGFRTAAFVAAFPLDHQFGLDRGFDVYSDRLPRAPDGRPSNERPASQVVDEAIDWLRTGGVGAACADRRRLLRPRRPAHPLLPRAPTDSSRGSTSSSRTRPMAMRRIADRCSIGTIKKLASPIES